MGGGGGLFGSTIRHERMRIKRCAIGPECRVAPLPKPECRVTFVECGAESEHVLVRTQQQLQRIKSETGIIIECSR